MKAARTEPRSIVRVPTGYESSGLQHAMRAIHDRRRRVYQTMVYRQDPRYAAVLYLAPRRLAQAELQIFFQPDPFHGWQLLVRGTDVVGAGRTQREERVFRRLQRSVPYDNC